MFQFKHLLCILLAAGTFGSTLLAQDEPEVSPASAPELSDQQKTLILLNQRLLQLQTELSSLSKKSTELTSEELLLKEAQIKSELKETRREISQVATGVDLTSLDGVTTEGINLADEFSQAVEPLIREFKEATSEQKETDKLRQDVDALQAQSDNAEAALQNLKTTIEKTSDPRLKSTLKEELDRWEKRSVELQTKLQASKFQLEERLRNKPTLFEALSFTISDFCRTRGAHLFFALGISIGIFFLLRSIGRFSSRLRPKKKAKQISFTEHLIAFSYSIFTILGGVIAFIFALWVFNDWVLLTLTLFLLFGIIWAGKNTLPLYFEQTKLMLNLGTVRAWERVVYQGIPWEVQRIAPYTTFTNPQLEGGKIRLPLRDIQELHSRPTSDNELWFPCSKDDWVELSDGTFGKCIQQTPDYVHLVKLGGSRIVIPTADFLSLNPQNLSKNFRVEVTFGIDYKYQKISTSEVPTVFEEALTRELIELVGKDDLLNVKVHFHSASASSLDYRITADFKGEIASQRSQLRDQINRICVDVCNEHQWSIPFTQITVHQAASK